jgi:hypothetical protein
MLSKNNFIGHDLFILQRLNCLFKTPAKDYFANTIGTMTLRQKINAPSTYDAESDDNLCNNEQTTHKHSVASKRSLTKIYDQKFDEYETKLGDIGFKLSELVQNQSQLYIPHHDSHHHFCIQKLFWLKVSCNDH